MTISTHIITKNNVPEVHATTTKCLTLLTIKMTAKFYPVKVTAKFYPVKVAAKFYLFRVNMTTKLYLFRVKMTTKAQPFGGKGDDSLTFFVAKVMTVLPFWW